ncbi:MAG: LacI family DNA-binding transcriptional regulator, partial [Anaerolineae bacterium]|nr:LacI family DNA-binding transcriptional regulator [Anaerolineae bacterium]
MTVTLKDIARQVNRSVTTVSRALHDYADVSPE